MKKLILSAFALFAAMTMACAQAAKPSIMVYPSDSYCINHGFYTTVQKNGEEVKVPNVQRALVEDSDLRTVVRAIGSYMAQNNFPLTDVETELKNLNDLEMMQELAMGKDGGMVNEETPLEMLLRNAKPDIMLSVDLNIQHRGPKFVVDFALDAIDSYTGKRIDGLQNPEGSEGRNISTLVMEGVNAVQEQFFASLLHYFNDMATNGREIVVSLWRMDSWAEDFETEYEYNGDDYELSDIIRSWFNKNTVSKRYTVRMKTANRMEFTQVRIPLYTTDLDGEQMANDAESFGKKLARSIKKTAGVNVGVVPRGLGSVVLYVGEKVQ